MSYNDKINQAAKILGETPERIQSIFDEQTFDVMIANLSESEVADFITFSIVGDNDSVTFSTKAKVAARILKASETPIVQEQKPVDAIAILRELKPVANWSDEEILNAFIANPTDELESQLVVRSKGRRFIITEKLGSDVIKVPETLAMLKKARKDEIPEFIRSPDGIVTYVYRMNEINTSSRLRHECPFDANFILFDDYCAHCDINFAGIGKRERQLLRLCTKHSSNLNTPYSLKNVTETARKGFDALAIAFPGAAKQFFELESVGKLPSLVKMEKPHHIAIGGDPFKVRG